MIETVYFLLGCLVTYELVAYKHRYGFLYLVKGRWIMYRQRRYWDIIEKNNPVEPYTKEETDRMKAKARGMDLPEYKGYHLRDIY